MSFFKSPVFFAIVAVTVIAIVIFMMYRDVKSLRTSVVDVVNEHNNAKHALDSHARAIGDLRKVFIGDDMYDDEEEVQMDQDAMGAMIDGEGDEFDDPEIKPTVKSSGTKKHN
jgi:hypothetical protein